jgi:hypothetical protein
LVIAEVAKVEVMVFAQANEVAGVEFQGRLLVERPDVMNFLSWFSARGTRWMSFDKVVTDLGPLARTPGA